MEEKEVQLCAQCGKEGEFQVCGRCRIAYYCGVECQRAAWKTHKLTCVSRKAQPQQSSDFSSPSSSSAAPSSGAQGTKKGKRKGKGKGKKRNTEEKRKADKKGLKLWDGRGVPPWYPSSPPWIHDEHIKKITLSVMMQQGGALIAQLLGNTFMMHEQSVRYKLFGTKRREKGNAIVTFKEFETMAYDSGFLIGCKRSPNEKKAVGDWFEWWNKTGHMYQHLREEDWECPCRTMQVFCDRKGCNNLCNSVCICEEAYCSPECLQEEWKNHEEMCLTVRDNNELGQVAHQLSWHL